MQKRLEGAVARLRVVGAEPEDAPERARRSGTRRTERRR